MIGIISLDNRIFLMSRDLAHATVIGVDMSDSENYFIKCFIPKNTNWEMMGILTDLDMKIRL